MRTLLAKEFRALVPIILLALCLALIDDIDALLAGFPDLKLLSTFFDPNESANDLTIELVLIGLIMAAGLLVREADEGTLAFLDGLPISRTRIFSAKAVAAVAVLTGVMIVEMLGAGVLHLLSRTSLEGAFPWRTLAVGFALNWIAGFAFLGLALALSFLRRWMYLVLGLLAWAFLLGQQHGVPWLDLLNPLELARPVMINGQWPIPHQHAAVQLAMGIVCLLVALAAFHLLGDGTRRLADRLQRVRGGRFISGVGMLLIPAVWLGFFIYIVKDETGSSPESAAAEADPAERAYSARYVLISRTSQAAAAAELMKQADEVHEKVTAFLGATPLGEPITVDTTSELQRHNAGQAHWKKIRMLLTNEEEEDSAATNAAVLAHETVHVYLDQLSEFRLMQQFSSVRFFHEGVASYIQHRLFETPEALADFRRPAAVAHARGLVAFEQLADDGEFTRRLDANLAYPLGELWCAAVVHLHGGAALGKIARAFARPDAPKGLGGVGLWQDTLQACGISLEAVLAEFRAELDRLVAAERAFIDKLPRVTATLERVGEEIVIRPAFTGDVPGRLVCTTRPRPAAAEYELEYLWPRDDGTFRVARDQFAGATLWYQLGWRVSEAEQTISEPWVEGPLP